MNPTGGLPRRRSALEALQKKGPALVVDSGNALFALEGKTTDELKLRAAFILETMGKLGTKVMAAGLKDVGAGAGWLKQTAAKAGVKVISVNLKENGERVFDGSTVISAAGTRIAFIGVTQPGLLVGETPMAGEPIIPAVRDELAKLKGKADLFVLLAAVRQPDAFELAKSFKEEIAFVIRSGDQAGNMPPQRDGGAWVLSAGARGQALATLALKLDGRGDFIDLADVGRQKELLASLDLKLKDFEPRVKAAKDAESKKLMEGTLKELRERRAEQKKKVDPGVAPGARTFEATFVVLDSAVPDEPALKTEVLKYEPTYSGAH